MPQDLSRAFSVADLARLARARLPRAVWDFYAGGAEDEMALARNCAALARIKLAPRVLMGVSQVETGIRLLGARSAMPLGIAPLGGVGFGRRDGDIALARGAARAGVPYVLSTAATTSIERVAKEAGGRLWFQLYPLKQKDATWRLVERARLAGFEALVLTVDVPVGGKRERDLRNDFAVPFRFTPRNMLDFASRPLWALDMLIKGLPVMENMAGLAAPDASAAQIASSVGREFDPGFDWEHLRELRARWPGKLLLKGVLRADDALRAADLGCDAVVVSNHGGRQLDAAAATLDALPAIVAAAGQRLEILVDGGIRRGSDIVKALALGADAVLIGRPALYGACAAGEAGVDRVLHILREELVRTMRLCGIADLAALQPGSGILHHDAGRLA